jgi:hypothetical protein
MPDKSSRRTFLNQTFFGVTAAGVAAGMHEGSSLAAVTESGSQRPAKPDIAPGSMPQGKIGQVRLSRLILGGNLIGGWSHSRDLLYVSKLMTSYNTEAKIFETLELAEQCGMNMIQLDPRAWETLRKYNRQRKRNFQSLICTMPDVEPPQMADHIKQLVDKGATLVYVHGVLVERWVMAGRIDALGKTLDLIKAQNMPAGIGGHSLETVIACEKNKLPTDYYLKTLHTDRYWSATVPEKREEWCWYKGHKTEPGGYHDNMFCLDAEKTVAYMQAVAKPWVAFKTMAAGAIHPQLAFSYACRHGADFILAGMFDFQVEQDAKLAITAFEKFKNRKRPWHG